MPAKTYSISIFLGDETATVKFQKKAGKLVLISHTAPEDCKISADEDGFLWIHSTNKEYPIRLQVASDKTRFQLSLMYSTDPDITKVAQYYECTTARLEDDKNWEMMYNEFPEQGNLA